MSRRYIRAVSHKSRDVVAAAEATLTGRLVMPGCWDEELPGWAWLNTLAHAEWAMLAELADGDLVMGGSAWDGP